MIANPAAGKLLRYVFNQIEQGSYSPLMSFKDVLKIFGSAFILVALLGILLLLDGLNIIELTPWKLRTQRKGDWACINNYHDFIYQMTNIRKSGPRYEMQFIEGAIYPSDPWKKFEKIPRTFDYLNGGHGYGYYVELATKDSEIWIRTNNKSLIILGTPEHEYTLVSPHPIDQSGKVYDDVYISDIVELSNGNVIGINYPIAHDTTWETTLPLFSVYKDSNHTFEFLDIGLNFSANDIAFGWDGLIPRRGAIYTHTNKYIWIYQQHHGLYRLEISNTELSKLDFKNDQIIQSITTTPDGKLLFRGEKQSGWELLPGELRLYDPETNNSKDIEVPYPYWPDYGKLLYTQAGNLWFGIHGYRSIEGDWVLNNPRRKAYVNLGQSSERFNWSQPDLVFQSSNGYLWYSNNTGDFLGIEGAAWYDPKSKAGCWFTTEYGNIIEDYDNNLWMIADNVVYRLSLKMLEQ